MRTLRHAQVRERGAHVAQREMAAEEVDVEPGAVPSPRAREAALVLEPRLRLG